MPMRTDHPPKQKLSGLLPILILAGGGLAFGMALLAYAYLGTFSRYYADDYCLTSSFLTSGFWKSQIELYASWSPRFAGTFLLNLSEFFGRSAIRAWTALTILLWAAALTWVFAEVMRTFRLASRYTVGLGLVLAEALVFFTVQEAPQQYQSVFWRVGIITYTLPLVFLTALIGLIFNRVRKTAPERVTGWGAAVCALLAFFAGGFSETYVALQGGLLALALIGVWLGVKPPLHRNARLLVGAALAGSLLALLVVFVAPGNAVRLGTMPARPTLLALLRMSMTSAFVFIHSSLKEFAFQNLLTLLLPLLLTYGLYAREDNLPKIRPSTLTLSLILVPIIGFLLVLAVCAPSAYAESAYPEARVLIEARFMMVAAMIVEGALLGISLGQLHRWAGEPVPAFLQAFIGVLFLCASLYPLYDARKTVLEIPIYREWAAAWDAHDAAFRASVQKGVLDINLFDPQARSFDDFSGLLEISSDAKNWVNQCAAGYYGAHHLAINQP